MLGRDKYWWQKRPQFLLTQWTGGRLAIFSTLKHGVSDVADIVRVCPSPRVVVDVGANSGQSAIRFHAAFPSARIISFEPVTSTFKALQQRTAGHDIEIYQLAAGSQAGNGTIFLTDSTFTSSIRRPTDTDVVAEEPITIVTLDEFAVEHKISEIDLLKIDAEGYDIEVLQGGTQLLSTGKVRFVLIEVGFRRGDERHPLFDDVRDLIASYSFGLFGIYEQTLELTGEQRVRYANALFCRQ